MGIRGEVDGRASGGILELAERFGGCAVVVYGEGLDSLRCSVHQGSGAMGWVLGVMGDVPLAMGAGHVQQLDALRDGEGEDVPEGDGGSVVRIHPPGDLALGDAESPGDIGHGARRDGDGKKTRGCTPGAVSQIGHRPVFRRDPACYAARRSATIVAMHSHSGLLRETIRESVTLLQDEDLHAVRDVVAVLIAAPQELRELVRQRVRELVRRERP